MKAIISRRGPEKSFFCRPVDRGAAERIGASSPSRAARHRDGGRKAGCRHRRGEAGQVNWRGDVPEDASRHQHGGLVKDRSSGRVSTRIRARVASCRRVSSSRVGAQAAMECEASRTRRVEASTSWVAVAIRLTLRLISPTAPVIACMLTDISWATAACCSTAVEMAEEISLTSAMVWPMPVMATAA